MDGARAKSSRSLFHLSYQIPSSHHKYHKSPGSTTMKKSISRNIQGIWKPVIRGGTPMGRRNRRLGRAQRQLADFDLQRLLCPGVESETVAKRLNDVGFQAGSHSWCWISKQVPTVDVGFQAGSHSWCWISSRFPTVDVGFQPGSHSWCWISTRFPQSNTFTFQTWYGCLVFCWLICFDDFWSPDLLRISGALGSVWPSRGKCCHGELEHVPPLSFALPQPPTNGELDIPTIYHLNIYIIWWFPKMGVPHFIIPFSSNCPL